MISFNGKVVGMHDTVGDSGIERDCTLRCSGRVRGGAQRFRQPQPDIPGQWTCSACGQERVWPVRNRCFRCGVAKGHDPAPSVAPPYVVGPTGREPQRSNPVNPTYRPNQRQPQPMVPSASVQSFPPLNQPVSPRDVFTEPPPLIEETPKMKREMMRPWKRVILFLVLELALSSRPNVSSPRQLLSSECWEKEGCVVEYT